MTRTARGRKPGPRSAEGRARHVRAAAAPARAPARLASLRAREARGVISKADQADEVIASWRRELPEVAGLTLEACKRTARLSALMDEVLGLELAKLGLTRAEYAVLATLRRIGQPHRLRPSELAASLLLSSGGMSNVIKRIGDAGYVRRSGDPHDGRSSSVELTADGVAVAEKAVRQAIAAQKALLAPVPKAKVRALSDLLREILVALGDGSSERRRSAP